jgi:type VI protein secretion system component Hcp
MFEIKNLYSGGLNNSYVGYSDHGHVSNNGMVPSSHHHLTDRMSIIQMVRTQNPATSCKITQPRDLNSGLLLVHYSNGSVIRRAVIQIPTVVNFFNDFSTFKE